MDSVLFLIFALAYAVLLFWGIALIARRRRMLLSDLVLLIVAALVYDNGILAAGVLIGEGAALEASNGVRFWAHAFATPLLVLIGWRITVRAGARWARTVWAAVAAIVITLALIAYEVVVGVIGMRLVAVEEYGALSYTNEHAPEGPPAMVLAVEAVLLLAGIVTWVKSGWPWLTIAAVVMAIGAAVPWSVPSGAATNLFELLLLTGILATIAFQDRTEPAPTPAAAKA